jgi:hypothetical protein
LAFPGVILLGSLGHRNREDRMAKTAEGFKTRLEPQDEYPHDPGEAKNYNESMYFNVFDPAKKTGGCSGSAIGRTRTTRRSASASTCRTDAWRSRSAAPPSRGTAKWRRVA